MRMNLLIYVEYIENGEIYYYISSPKELRYGELKVYIF